MRSVLHDLGDRLLERLVPRTTARAADVGAMATWTERCYCGDAGSPPPGNYYRCRWIYRVCDSYGGVTTCSPCNGVGGGCC